MIDPLRVTKWMTQVDDPMPTGGQVNDPLRSLDGPDRADQRVSLKESY